MEVKRGGICPDVVGRDQQDSSCLAMAWHGLGAGRDGGDGQEQLGDHSSSGVVVGNTGTRPVEALESGAAGWQSSGSAQGSGRGTGGDRAGNQLQHTGQQDSYGEG